MPSLLGRSNFKSFIFRFPKKRPLYTAHLKGSQRERLQKCRPGFGIINSFLITFTTMEEDFIEVLAF
jgi:hypothetical protein